MGEVALVDVAVPKGLISGPFGSNLGAKDYVNSGVPVIRGANMGEAEVGGDFVFVTREKFDLELRRCAVTAGDLVFTQRGTLGQVALVPSSSHSEYVVSQSQMGLRLDEARAVPRFVYYACREARFLKQVSDNAIATGVPHINLGILARLTIPDLPPSVQRAIADVLGAVDDKIAANNQSLRLVDALMRVQYEAALVTGARTVILGEVAEFHNRKRVPLSSRQREVRRGQVPYYGAAGRLDTVDEALFDRPLVLVGEDGSVITDDGSPVVQYIWGPSWVNNHAHVLTGNGIETEVLRYALLRTNVAHLVTGAVQPKISMGNLRKLELGIPKDVSQINRAAADFSAVIRALSDENAQLARTRDELLPLLMSGKLRVKDAESVVSEVL